MEKITASISKSYAAFAKLLGDLWNGRGWFARAATMSRWRILLVECAVLAVVCGGFYLMRYQASSARYRETLSRTSNELRAVVLDLEAERRVTATVAQRRDLLAGFVLDKEAQAQLLSAMTDTAAHPGLEFVSMSPLPKENLEQYARCRASLAVEGGFGSFLRFLRKLESEGTPCSIIEIDVTSPLGTERARSGSSRSQATRSPGKEVERISFLVETYAVADPPALEKGQAK